MAIMKETDQRFLNIERKIGIFVLTAVVGVLAVVVLIGLERDLFSAKTGIFFIASSAEGIDEGMAVKLSGFKIGTVKRVSLTDVARVRVDLSVNSDYMKWVKVDSKAILTKEGLIGEGVIRIESGSPRSASLQENSEIGFERQRGLSEMALELKDEIKPALADARQLIHDLNDPQGDMKQALMRLRSLSENLASTRERIDALVQHVDVQVGTTGAKIRTLVDSTQQAVSRADGVVATIERQLPPLIEKATESIDNIQRSTETIRQVVDRVAPQVPFLLEKTGEVAGGAKEVVDSVKAMWPVRLYIKPPEEKTLSVDSGD